jgi:polar amino acid transport system permease protein
MLQTLHGIAPWLFDLDIINNYGGRLWAGLIVTCKVVGISCSLGFLLAYPVSLARGSRNWFLSSAAAFYITLFRGTPLLCQLYLVYYGAGQIRPELDSIGLWYFFREAYFCCILTFTMNTSAYQAEIMRGAVASVPKGQLEAAKALGLSHWAIARHVVWPQALMVAVRPLGNELISIVKVSALAAIVTLLDLMGETRFIFARTFDFSVYLYCAIIYLMITELIRRVVNATERRVTRHLMKEGSKDFFSEEKKQKTFIRLARLVRKGASAG